MYRNYCPVVYFSYIVNGCTLQFLFRNVMAFMFLGLFLYMGKNSLMLLMLNVLKLSDIDALGYVQV
jgi:cytosine/uracil/thiamine/allantoin permease